MPLPIISFLLKISGKDGLKIDKRINANYIVRQCWKYGCMMFRGKVVSLLHKNIPNDIFVGSRVTILETKYIKAGKKCKLHSGVYIDALSEEGVTLGNYVVLGRSTRIECTGSLEHLGKGIYIGDRSTFSNDCYFGAAGGIEIGQDVVAGQYIRFHSENHDYDDVNILIKDQGVSHKGIKIGNNCWIGSGAVFLDGAELDNGCVVAANSVVTKKYPENCVIGGIPAKILKYRGAEYNDSSY